MKNLITILSFAALFSVFFANAQDDAYRYRNIDSMLQLLKTQQDTALVATYRAVFSTYASRDPEKAKPYLDTAFVLTKDLNNPKIKVRLLKDLGHYHDQMGEYAKAMPIYQQAIDSCIAYDMKPLLQLTYNNMGTVKKYLGDLEGAMDSFLKSIQVSNELGETDDYRAPSYSNIGKLHAQLGNLEESNKYYRLTEEICLKFGLDYGLAITRSNLAENMITAGDYLNALPLYKHALTFFEKSNDFPEMGEQYNFIGDAYYNLDSLNQSKIFYAKALQIGQQIKEKKMLMNGNHNLGRIAIREGSYERALAFLTESTKIAKEAGNNLELVKIYPDFAKAHAALGQYQKAFHYSELHFAKYDFIFQKEKVEQINELEVKYQTQKKEAEIALQEVEINTLNEKARADKLQKGLYAGGMASALALFGLSVFGYRQRIKKNRIAREKQEEIYRQEIEHKKKELTSQTLHLVQKNTFIQELKENLENLKSSPDKFKTEFRRIVMLLKKENASDKDWEVFKTYFADVHNDFDQKLKTLYSDISEKEIRLAAFLRMNLTTKEIAATLNVLPDSILKSKYRLKKKLNLDKKTDLTSFLNTL
ncbi:tetratricopeptide repeat protein [Maribacter sp. 2308TA10-17]|uniref:tetratricopeptide repeat protein n=1 Tax=Maribacter sp. 2308TA10-17 TaxID=3386276 RepID=UPI0039BD328B